MGLFEFLKNAGKKLRIGDHDDDDKAAPKPAQPAPGQPAPSAEAFREVQDRRRAAALVKLLGDMGLQITDLGVRVDDEKVTLTGSAPSQEVREKAVLLVGNVDGIAKVDDQLTVAQQEPQATFYTVKSGDNLSKISQQHYGKASLYNVIFEANRPMLKDPDEIYPGQVLRIPPQPGT
jgi:nucleoid-associated protein YgaU